MFLTARLFGIFTYIFVMVIFLLLTKYTKRTQTKYVLFFYLVSLSTIAYFYVPFITADVYRHSINAKSLSLMPWYEFWDIIKNLTSGISFLFYFRYFADYLSTATCFIIYGIIFYMIYNFSNKQNASKSIITLVLFWIMTNDFYLVSISNIRSYISAILVVFCIYREMFHNKFGIVNIFLYLCAIEMHSMGIVFVVFRFGAYLFMKGQLTIFKIILFNVVIFIVVMGKSFYLPLLNFSIVKLEAYYSDIGYDYIWERVIFIIQTIVQIYVLLKAFKYQIFKDKIFAYYKSIIVMAVIILVLCHLRVPYVQRWIFFSAILEIPLLIELLRVEKELNRTNIKNFLITTSIITFIFVCSRGNLCGLKFWE